MNIELITDFISKYAKSIYRKPEFADDTERMVEMRAHGQKAVAELKRVGEIWESRFGLQTKKRIAWQNSGYIVGSFWLQGRLKECADCPESLSLFVERTTSGVRIRVSVIPDYKNTDWKDTISKDRERYLKILDIVSLDDRLCFVSYDRDKEYGEKFTFAQAKIGNWQKSPWKGAALSFIVEENTLDGINEGVELLMPYYRNICSEVKMSECVAAPCALKPAAKTMACSGTKTQKLQVLFADWQEAQKNEPDSSWQITNGGNSNITKAHFQIDGIVDEEVFADEQRKILFISNEANGNEYGAKERVVSNCLDDYRTYYEIGYDNWKGKMRERVCALYKIAARRRDISDADAAIHFAFMDLNKRGGGASVKGGEHIVKYCEIYADFIRQEIEIIDPDVVIWLGTNTYDRNIACRFLGAKDIGHKRYFMLFGKQVPIIRMWHTAYYQSKIESLPGYRDKTVGKLCAKLETEMTRYGL